MSALDRRRFLQMSSAATAVAVMPAAAFTLTQPLIQSRSIHERGLLLCIDPRLEAEGESFRQRIVAAAATSPLLIALSAGTPLLRSKFAIPTQPELAFNHVILIALPNDPLLIQAWQREASFENGLKVARGLYAFGFGHVEGSIGYLESDRNPFLHAAAVAKAPYEAQWISLTGTDHVGVAIAVDAFLTRSLVNGLVGAAGWQRGAATLLDRDPLSPDFTVPGVIPSALGGLHRIAITQVAEDEYRGVLTDAGVTPRSIWHAKYHAPGQWDASGQASSFYNYAVGLHRRAYGNSAWVATFRSPSEAAAAAPRIAKSASLTASAARWIGHLPPYAWGHIDMGDDSSTGTLELYVEGASVVLTALSQPL